VRGVKHAKEDIKEGQKINVECYKWYIKMKTIIKKYFTEPYESQHKHVDHPTKRGVKPSTVTHS